MRRHGHVPRHERLVDALADEILSAADAEILASHTAGAARVVANCQRQALQRAIARASETAETPRKAPRAIPVRRDRDDEERR